MNIPGRKINTVLNYAFTNSRSLPPKVIALVETFRELSPSFFVITETWLRSTSETASEIKDLLNAEKISLLVRNCSFRGGCVAIAFDTPRASLKPVPIEVNHHKILCVTGPIIGLSRKIVITVIYIPPKITADKLDVLNTLLANSLDELHSMTPSCCHW